jgi:hypothetical protein
LDSADPAAHDCYRIKNRGSGYELAEFTQIATGPNGTTNMAIAVSQAHEAVALLGKDGRIPFQELTYIFQGYSGLNTMPHISSPLEQFL